MQCLEEGCSYILHSMLAEEHLGAGEEEQEEEEKEAEGKKEGLLL